ncbi:MAG: hypothetical protein IT430_09800 [Phycisphaerales bacterium]|nr:hypothetical protein [Phycisphaerales bacterium]
MTPEQAALRDEKRQRRGQILEALAMFREHGRASVSLNQLESLLRNVPRAEIEAHIDFLIEAGYVQDAAPPTNVRVRHQVTEVRITNSGSILVDGWKGDDGVKFGA